MALCAAELRHFAEKGWVMRPGLFTADECHAMRCAIDTEITSCNNDSSLLGRREDAEESDGAHFGRIVVSEQLQTNEALRRVWRDHPGIEPALVQLLGSPPQWTGDMTLVTPPHPRRREPEMRAVLRDDSEMVWHRGIRPKWGLAAGARKGEIYTSWLHTVTFLTGVSEPEDGGTLVLVRAQTLRTRVVHAGEEAVLRAEAG
jgi:hypothetical protein|eukprot:COSAG01_NODE_441_length_17032_cov_27.546389_10_plen_202_part_00